ncbi:GntR family transcriptional regulator YhfZ [Halanaerobium kushneri]|uniref:Helix-turn-helix domain-containing protein n=1 Tax=Halanaerobium kushneri TaxID=56779 RepID=A0A1N6QS20_9FIRM|nr:GntR family transcriptional regulator YhfZ [Halanaerobium kushneri]SIQ19348.1 Helix-turn-helix domain-containing protein [Halanaerobium kushneri]
MFSEIKSKMMSKIGFITSMLARDFFLKNVGERIDTISGYAERYGTGRGTVQSAISFLTEHQAVELESKGHLGSYILSLDYQLLWEIADLGMIMGLLPLPYSLRYEGLATGLNKQFKAANFNYSIAYTRGAEKRLNVLKDDKYDFIVLSKFAAKNYNDNDQFEILYEFGSGTYLSKHVIVFSGPENKKIESGMKIGLDSTSIDHKVLTELECQNKEVEFVELTYMKIMEHIKNKTIDAAIWNYDEIKNLDNINFTDLQHQSSIKKNKEISNAVILVNKNSRMIKRILSKTINPESVIEVQKEVYDHKLIPEY